MKSLKKFQDIRVSVSSIVILFPFKTTNSNCKWSHFLFCSRKVVLSDKIFELFPYSCSLKILPRCLLIEMDHKGTYKRTVQSCLNSNCLVGVKESF